MHFHFPSLGILFKFVDHNFVFNSKWQMLGKQKYISLSLHFYPISLFCVHPNVAAECENIGDCCRHRYRAVFASSER